MSAISVPTGQRHRLLERQLRRARTADGEIDLDVLLASINEAYEEHDAARRLNDHAVQLMSRELGELHASAQKVAKAQWREADARVQALLEEAVEAVINVDADGFIIAFNPAAERMLGYAADEVMGRHLSMLYRGWGEAGDAQIKALLQETERRVVSIDARPMRKSGESFDAEITCTRIEIDGRVSLMGMWRDVTARKAQEAALVRQKNEAEAASRAKSAFLAAMSHEIRTPLNGVLGMAAAMEHTPLSEDQRRMIRTIIDSGRTLTTLLSDILDLSKIEAGRLELEVTPFDLGASVHAVASLFEGTVREKGLEFELRAGPGVEGLYLGDPTRIRQILQNLVSNAVKFTDQGRVGLEAEVAVRADGGHELAVSVTDTGVGISEAARKRLFQKFAQADVSTTRRFGGTGLGLSICRELVHAMGGEIDVESVEGQGSRFWFRIPLTRVAEAEAESENGDEAAGALEASLKILVADDNATNRMVLKALLETMRGLEAEFVENGRQALEAVEAGAYDIVLMDVHMPVMDGLAATRAIRALPSPKCGVAIVAVSAEAMPEQVREILAAGMDAHVAKPLRPDNLFLAMEQALSVRSPSAEAEAA